MKHKKFMILVLVATILIAIVALSGKEKKTNPDHILPSQAITEPIQTEGLTVESTQNDMDMEVESILIDEQQSEDESLTPTGNIINSNNDDYLSHSDDTKIVQGGVEFDE